MAGETRRKIGFNEEDLGIAYRDLSCGTFERLYDPYTRNC
jgi:hypothetical protein